MLYVVLSWKMSHVSLKRIHVLMPWGWGFFKCHLGQVTWWSCAIFCILIDFLPAVSLISTEGILKFLIVIFKGLIHFLIVCCCFMYFRDLLIVAYIIVIYSYFLTVIIIKYPSLFYFLLIYYSSSFMVIISKVYIYITYILLMYKSIFY